MKRRFSKILLPAIACFLIGNAAVGASERVRFFVKVSDLSLRPPERILRGVKGGMRMGSAKQKPAGKKMGVMDSGKMSGSKGDSSPVELVAQKWDDQKQRLVRTTLRAPEADIDV